MKNFMVSEIWRTSKICCQNEMAKDDAREDANIARQSRPLTASNVVMLEVTIWLCFVALEAATIRIVTVMRSTWQITKRKLLEMDDRIFFNFKIIFESNLLFFFNMEMSGDVKFGSVLFIGRKAVL